MLRGILLARSLHREHASSDAIEIMNPEHSSAPAGEIRGTDFDLEVLKSTTPVLVAFVAPWSQACRVLDSVLAEVAGACLGRVRVLKINADDNPDLSLWYEIQSIPSLLLFVNGLPRARLVGTASKEAILAKLQAVSSGGSPSSSTPQS
jgi:thioredoxin 1